MRIERITITGVLRFTKKTEVDLSAIPPGLIAVTGANGEGKTTLIEAPLAALYREFPSRRGRALVDYAHGVGLLECQFSVNGTSYKATVSLDRNARKTEAVISAESGGMADLGPPVPLTDGKVTTYDAYVREHFPSLEVMLASAFSCQNRRGSFISLDRKSRKDLFCALLGLERYEAWATQARDHAAEHRTASEKCRTAIETLEQLGALDDEAFQELVDRRAGTEDEFKEAKLLRDEATRRLTRNATQLEEINDQVRRHEAAKRDVAAANERHNANDFAARESRTRMDRALAAEASNRRDIDVELRGALEQLEHRRRSLEGILSRADGLAAAEAEIAEAKLLVGSRREAGNKAVEGVDLARERLNSGRDQLAHQGLLRGQLESMQDQVTILGKVPCGGRRDYAVCQFLVNATAAREELGDLQVAVNALEPVDMVAHKENFTNARARHAQCAGELDEAVLQLERLEGELTDRTEIALAQERVSAIEGEKLLAHDRAERGRAEATQRIEDAVSQFNTEERTHRARELELNDQREACARVCVETENAVTDSVRLKGLLDDDQAKLEQLAGTTARLQQQMLGQDEQHEEMATRRHKCCDLFNKMRVHTTELSEWRFLERCFGREGLPVIEIANAGPGVSTRCNQLLEACFGARFTLQFVTQEAKVGRAKNGSEFKEAFTIQILDHERGGEPRDITDLSGGEQIIIDEALKNAIAIYANERSEMRIETCWRDETTGPLDPDNRDRYLTMLRKVQELGGFHHMLYVTHSAEAAARADAQIVLRHGEVEVFT